MQIGYTSTIVFSPNASVPKGKRKPKGWTHRYQLILQPTDVGQDRVANRWHKIKRYGKTQGAGTWGPIHPHPGDDLSDEQLVMRAGVDDVTVPVEILRPRSKLKA